MTETATAFNENRLVAEALKHELEVELETALAEYKDPKKTNALNAPEKKQKIDGLIHNLGQLDAQQTVVLSAFQDLGDQTSKTITELEFYNADFYSTVYSDVLVDDEELK